MAKAPGAFILESRRHAEARGAKPLARILGFASTCEPRNGQPLGGTGLKRAISAALAEAGLSPEQIGHVNAHGVGTVPEDELEARVLHACMPDVPVTAPKSLFGNLAAAGGAWRWRPASWPSAMVASRPHSTIGIQTPIVRYGSSRAIRSSQHDIQL